MELARKKQDIYQNFDGESSWKVVDR